MLGQKAKRKSIFITLLILLFGIFLTTVILLAIYFAPVIGDNVVLYPVNLGSYSNTSDYEINPNTILADLDREETNLFSPMLTTPEAPVSKASGSFSWHQEDYLKIANALHQFVWKEPIDSWDLYSMQFNRGCQDGLSGFDSAEFTFYKTIKVNGKQVYTAHGIAIYPLFAMVSWGGDNFPRPLIFGWQSINLTKLKLTADNALQIAEQNGGQNARWAVNNNCNIYLTVSPNDWYVLYSGEAYSSLFYIRIDVGNGRYTILSVKNQ